MRKQTVAAACAADPALDVPGLLRRLSDRDLPANVARELSEWTLHSDKFVLYANACVLEADPELEAADRYTVERPSPGIRVVHSPDKLFAELERRELLPMRVRHGEKAWSRLPRNSRTRFPKGPEAPGKARKPKARVKLLRVTRVQLQCPDREFLEALQRVLMEANCPVETNAESLTLSYSKLCEPQVSQAVRALRKDYRITIEDADQGIAKK